MVNVYVYHDYDADCPLPEGVVLHSFNWRHTNHRDPESLGILGAYRGQVVCTPGLLRRIKCNTALILSAYSHGGVVWSLKGEGYQCPWDTAQVAGLLEIPAKLVKPADRKAFARKVLANYNEWCNGNCYILNVEDEDGEMIGYSLLGYPDRRTISEVIGVPMDQINTIDRTCCYA